MTLIQPSATTQTQTELNQFLSGQAPQDQTELNQLLNQVPNQNTDLNRFLQGAATEATGVSPFVNLPDVQREALEGTLGVAGDIGDVVKHAAIGIAHAGEGLIRLPEFAGRNLAALLGTEVLGKPEAVEAFISEEERTKAKLGTALGISLALQPLATAGIATSLGAVGVKGTAAGVLSGTGGTTAAGASFGALRPRGEGESLAEAIVVDAAIFAGLHLAGALLFRNSRPIKLPADEILEKHKDELVLGGSPAVRNQLDAASRAVAEAELAYFSAAREAGVPFSQATDILNRRGGLPIRTTDAPVQEGFVRLYRAESPTVKFEDVFNLEKLRQFGRGNRKGLTGKFYTQDPAYADYFRQTYGPDAVVRSVDVPQKVAKARQVSPVEFVMNESSLAKGVNRAKGTVNVEAFKNLRELRAHLERVKLAEVAKRRLLEGTKGEDIATALEYGKAVAEEVADISAVLTKEGLPVTSDILAGLSTGQIASIAGNPRNIGLFRRYLLSPSKWVNVGGVVGDAAGRVVWNAIDRANIAFREADTWRRILTKSRQELHRGKSRFGKGAREREAQLGRMLNTIFDPDDLPVTASENLRRAFEPLREKLLSDRETLRMLTGASIDFGIDAYLPHVFVGEWAIKNAKTGSILRVVDVSKVKSTLNELSRATPEIPLRVEPRHWQIPAGFTSGQMRRAFGTKFFAHVQARTANLPGFVENPYTALETYSVGFGRKVAYHDFKQKASAITNELRKVKGADLSASVLDSYVDRVLGLPGPLERHVRATLESISGATAKGARKLGVGGTIEEATGFFPDIVIQGAQSLASKLTYYEAIARLGYSPTAWFVNMSQTAVNTASAIGWGPTMRGIRLLSDRSQRNAVDQLLRQFEIELNVPLAMADQITKKMVGDLSVWHPLYWFNRVEQANRAIAGLSKYQEQILRGAGHVEAVQSAKKFIAETQFIYNIADTPALMQGPLGSAAFQFKKFVIKELEFLWSLRKNPRALGRFVINIQAIGGVSALFSLPPTVLLDWATKKATGETLSDRVLDAYPRLARGFPGLVGVDLGANVAPGVPSDINTRELLGPGPNDIMILAREVASPALLDLISERKGNLTPKELGRAVGQLAPVVARRLWDAYQILDEERVRVRGTQDVLFFPSEPKKEVVMTALGARSLERAEASRQQRLVAEEIQSINQADQQAVQRWANAFLAGDEERARKILEDARERGLYISSQQLQAAVVRAYTGRSLGLIRGAPRETREEALGRLGRFLPR